MSSETLIKVEHLSKCYQIYEKPRDRLLQMFMRGRRQYFREFWALKDISFEVKRGETVGIIGRNGSGKSTLLQMICGTLNPTAGGLQTYGRIAALLELGAGFNPEFTGRENVYLAASLYGLSRAEIDERFDQIAAFADIGEFIEQPVKTYSSGMFVRLAFAVIAHVDADILVVDEALSVGDAYFVQKCMRFLRSFMERGTLLFCSHELGAVLNLCNKAILLERGQIAAMGTPKTVTESYLAALCETVPVKQNAAEKLASINSVATITEGETDLARGEYKDARQDYINASNLRNDIEVFKFNPAQAEFGTGEAKVTLIRLLNKEGIPFSWVVGGEDVVLEIRCKTNKELRRPIIGFLFKDRLGQVIFTDNTFLSYQFDTPTAKAGGIVMAQFEFRMPVLPSGEYSVDASIADGSQDQNVQHHWVHDALIIRVHASPVYFGLVGVPMRKILLDTKGL